MRRCPQDEGITSLLLWFFNNSKKGLLRHENSQRNFTTMNRALVCTVTDPSARRPTAARLAPGVKWQSTSADDNLCSHSVARQRHGQFRRQVDAINPAAIRMREIPCRPANATSNIENAVSSVIESRLA